MADSRKKAVVVVVNAAVDNVVVGNSAAVSVVVVKTSDCPLLLVGNPKNRKNTIWHPTNYCKVGFVNSNCCVRLFG